ncbi:MULTISPECIES: M3 family oligoendopeptidase [unclassified Bacillus (in: firmicutes)]|uniref:M3 family oligoendopeptidase n=1 Tax=unclassified Bacillus (in: firmicutes) TaxID=185979 RepID=UPI0008E7FBFF|nr:MULTISPECIES: M3 family oligoendopeptidase [unclassified Bacillus (in: firmicutes)]SFK05958.1 oligoendopeptidase, pepF/M3 family [Bacillus sp. 71mf]SFS55975.1 oligoendopeptidase, pepF/M3 family [Bacillus sp. 103mf]
MREALQQRWSLEGIFPGGSESSEFKQFLIELEEDIFKETATTIETKELEAISGFERWIEQMNRIQELSTRLLEATHFVECLKSENVEDENAMILSEKVRGISSQFEIVINDFEQALVHILDEIWEQLLQLEQINPLAYPLQEKREKARRKLPVAQEKLIQDLSINGYHAWVNLYNSVTGKTKIVLEEEGQRQYLSFGQVYNLLHSSINHHSRRNLVNALHHAGEKVAETCAAALNNIAGFRLQVYKHRGVDSILTEPLRYNRMSQTTLDSMWEAVNQSKPIITSYLKRKARLLGLEKMDWFDMYTPIGKVTKTYTYEEAAEIILTGFHSFSPKLADYTERAFQEGWIDSENRDTKASSGFSARFPLTKQSRIFMNFQGTHNNLAILAHELGHSFHQGIISNDVPPFAQQYTMAVSETASTFAETIILNKVIQDISNEHEKLLLLEAKIQTALSYLIGVQGNFIFEKDFYEIRKKRVVGVDELSQLMEKAQQYAFNDYLVSYHDLSWIWNRHFYFTDKPFYNFPYTFGFLFSQGIYANALQEGHSFEKKYIDLLRDTGRMTAEQLAFQHLGFDLTKQEFWEKAMQIVLQDIKDFLALTEKSLSEEGMKC